MLRTEAQSEFLPTKLPCGRENDTGGGRVFSLDASFGLLATASASALALFLGSALSFCGVVA